MLVMARYLIFMLLILIAYHGLKAQGSSKFQLWNDFTPSYELAEKWTVGGDIGYRIQPSDGSQIAYVRPGISYKLNNVVKFTLGIANFNTWEPERFIKREIRTFQFIAVSWPNIAGFQFNHRLGIEQRWFYLKQLDLSDYVNRSRYYLELKSPEFKLFKLKSPFFATANLEILRDLGNNELGRLQDHNRYTLGIGNQISEQFRAEIRVKLINIVDPAINSFIREINILRVRLYYQFPST
jgi:Protein of unknown function (DUF2490)